MHLGGQWCMEGPSYIRFVVVVLAMSAFGLGLIGMCHIVNARVLESAKTLQA